MRKLPALLTFCLLSIAPTAQASSYPLIYALEVCVRHAETGRKEAFEGWQRYANYMNATEICPTMLSCDEYFEVVLDGPAAGSEDLIEVEYGPGLLVLHCGPVNATAGTPSPDLGRTLEAYFGQALLDGRLSAGKPSGVVYIGCAFDELTFTVTNDFADSGWPSFLVDLGGEQPRRACA